MQLYPDALLQQIRGLPTGDTSFLKQISAPDGLGLRRWLEAVVSQVPTDLRDRWTDGLSSFDNRRFFQSFAEAATAQTLLESGWTLQPTTGPSGHLAVTDQRSRAFQVIVVSFIRQTRPEPDRATIARLLRAINRVSSRQRLAVVVQRWLRDDFDVEPVRRAVDGWVQDVERGVWTGRYAAYDDRYVSLEFGLLGSRATPGGDVVAFQLGPFHAMRTREIVESRLVMELDEQRGRGPRQPPAILSVVCDQPWDMTPGFLRELLYGKPVWQGNEAGFPEHAHRSDHAPALFRDPLYRATSGVLFLERSARRPVDIVARAHLNPWAPIDLKPEQFSFAVEAESRRERDLRIIRWFDAPEPPAKRA